MYVAICKDLFRSEILTFDKTFSDYGILFWLCMSSQKSKFKLDEGLDCCLTTQKELSIYVEKLTNFIINRRAINQKLLRSIDRFIYCIPDNRFP